MTKKSSLVNIYKAKNFCQIVNILKLNITKNLGNIFQNFLYFISNKKTSLKISIFKKITNLLCFLYIMNEIRYNNKKTS